MENVVSYLQEVDFPLNSVDTVDPDLISTLCPDIEVEEVEKTVLNDIDLCLECDDDGNSYSPQKPNITPASIICNVNIKLSSSKNECFNPSFTGKYDKGFQCYLCRDHFSMESKYQRHMLQNHKIDRPFHCCFCNYSSTCTKLIVKHSKRKHQYGDIIKEIPRSDRKYYMIGENGVNEKVSELTNESRHLEKPVYKEIDSDNGANHLRNNVKNSSSVSEAENQVFFCCKCPYQTTTKVSLNYHVNAKHSLDRKIYSCKICEFTCKQKRTLDIHEKKHKSEILFGCDICQKGFYSNLALKRHVVTHCQDRPYACTHENCMKSFKFQGALTDHVKTVHQRKSDEKSEKMAESVTRKSSAGTNLSNNSELKYPSESETSKSKTKQVSIQGESSKFKCKWKNCKMNFRDNFNLEVHMATHTGNKKKKCHHCDFTCIQKSSLDWHLKKNHID